MSKSFDPEWEAIFQRREWGKYPPEHVVRFIAGRFYRVPDRSAVRLLDVGCGAGGACAWYMAREGFSVSAVDGSATAVEKAESRLRSEGLTAEFVQSDVISLPWPDDTFDAAVDNACLCSNTFENSRAIVREIARVLKPGGWLFSANLTDRCSDYGKGPAVEPGGFSQRFGDGPTSGNYFVRFAGRPHLDELYQPFARITVDLESHTVDGMAHVVESWLVTCQKAATSGA